MVESQENRSDDVAKSGISAMLWRPGVLVPVVLALVGTVAVPKLVRELPELSEYPAYQLSRSAVQVIPEKPDWVPEDFLLSVTGSEKWPEDGTPLLDATLVERVAEAFAEHRWVAEVERVERRVPAGVVVRLAFRRPVAWIETDSGRVAVDVTGVRLPGEDLVGETAERYPVVRGVTSQTPATDGVAWNDPSVVAAAQLAVELESYWEPFDLVAIVVKRRDPTGNSVGDHMILELLTRGGSRVVWGRSPGTGHPGELTTAQKIGRIMQFISHFDSLDPPDGPFEINIRHWHEIIFRSLKSASARSRTLRVLR